MLVRTQRVALRAAEGTALSLRGLRAGMYTYVVRVGERAPVRGVLVVQP